MTNDTKNTIIGVTGSVIILLIIFCTIGYSVFATIDIQTTINNLNGWESLGVVHNMKFTDCYGREYTSMSKFLGNTGVWLPDKTRMNINNLPTDKFYKVYKKDYWLIPTSYLVICTGD